MNNQQKLSLTSAILININIMMGIGLFINTVNLAKLAGLLGFLSYFTVALLVLPLIICMAALIALFPSGNFYSYASTISPLAGFLSAWTYFVAKLASASLMIHVSVSLLSQVVGLQSVSPFVLDALVIGLFAWLNTLNMKAGDRLMRTFIVLKLTPVLFVILSGIYMWQSWHIGAYSLPWSGIPSTIPLVLYAFLGFEASCSLARHIEHAERNGPKAIFFSFFFVIGLTTLFQLFFYLSTAGQLAQLQTYLQAFPALLDHIVTSAVSSHLTALFHIAIACSAIGGSYGILFSNHWNLFGLAQNGQVFGGSILTRVNKQSIPVYCVMAEAVICLCYLLLTGANQIILQQIGAFGSTITYFLSILGLLRLQKGAVVYLALASCLLLLAACVRNFLLNGAYSLIGFCLLLLAGLYMFWDTRRAGKAV